MPRIVVTFLIASLTLSPFTAFATGVNGMQSDCNLAPNPLVLAETSSTSSPNYTRLNVWGPNGLVSTGGASAASRLYPLTDHLGSVRFLTDASGNVVQGYTYTPYGTATSTMPSATTTSPYLFAGEQYDPETGLIYLRVRYYDPTTGRFIARDPVRGTLGNPITHCVVCVMVMTIIVH